MWRLADRQLDTFLRRGDGEFIGEFANPFAMLVIADLLGVPEEDHAGFAEALLHGTTDHGSIGSLSEDTIERRPSSTSTSSSPRTSRNADAPPATTCSRGSPPPRSPTAPSPRSSTSSGSPPTSSPPARRPRSGS